MQPKYHMTQNENIFLAKRNIVDYIWKSANLEGIDVTHPDTQAIYNGMSVAGYTIEDINVIHDLKHAWQFVLEYMNEEMNLEFIKKVHLLLDYEENELDFYCSDVVIRDLKNLNDKL